MTLGAFAAIAIVACSSATLPSSPDSGGADGASGSDANEQDDASAPFTGTDILVYRGGGGITGYAWDFQNWKASVSGRKVVDSPGPLPALDPFALVVLVAPGAGNGGAGVDGAEMAAITSWVKRGGTLLFDTDRNDTYGGYDLSHANSYITSALASLGVDIAVQGPVQKSGFFPLPLAGSDPLGADVGSLPCGDAAILKIGSGVTRVDTLATGTQAYYASASLGSGRVAVLVDTTCVIDDETTAGATTPLGNFLKDLTTR